ncbi:MAG: Ig-like domain-containing protein [Melioribacteraceae bacterium]
MKKTKYNFKKWLMPLLLVMFIIGCEERDSLVSPTIVTTPTVNSTSPQNAVTGVAFNSKITATFSEAMNSESITTATFTLMQGTLFVSGTVSYTGETATFAPSSNLAPNTAYTATVTTGAKDLEGSSLAKNYVWNFTTGAAALITPPTVTFTDPSNAETNVPFNQKIAATFSVGMDATTITASTFTLTNGTTSISGFVSYSGTTAIFAPSIALTPNTAYLATITTGAKDLAGNALASDYVWSYTTGTAAVITPPSVSSTDPINNETNVAFNQKIIAAFSKTMDASTITTSTFTLMQGTTPVTGFVSYSGTTATFSPAANLLANTVFTANITTGAKDLAGNTITNNYTWNFTTGAAAIITSPTISFTDPTNAATNVALNQKIAATFSRTMDASTLTSASFTLKQGTVSVPGFVSYTGTTATFAPASNLNPNSTYTATITNAAKDLAGNSLVNNYVWSFTAGAAAVITPPTINSTDPVNAQTNVPFNQKIAATFSKTMNAATLTTATFTLMQGTTSVSGFVSYSGTTANFAPAINLAPNTIYTATITTGAKDLAGNALAANYVWNFTTGSAAVITPPTISSTDPINSEINVPLNQQIAATFSKTMNASTITASTYTLMQGTTPISGFISYSGTTAIFSPSSNLAPNTVYTATITSGAKDLAGNALANNYVWTFTSGAAVIITPPTVTSTDPLNAAIGVALNQKIAATFSKTMNASTLQTSTFTLKKGATSVSGFVNYTGTTATFAPANNLESNSLYTATITTGAKDLAGNAIANDYVWTFSTGEATVVIPPVVTSTDPANLAVGVPLNQKIAATFSKTMNASTITTATYTVMQGSSVVTGFVSYSGTTALFTPSSNLTPNTLYKATITSEAKDLAGNALVNNYVWTFTSGAAVVITPPTINSTDPLNLAVGVALDKKVSATFSKSMNPSTIHTSTYKLMQGTTIVNGFVSYSGTTAVFSPSSNLAPNTLYTATITTGAKDLAGNALANDYVWTFTTGSASVVTPPTIISTDPISNAICVPINKHITATFSRPMNAATITTAIFTIMEVSSTTFLSGTVSYSGTTATFIPLINLKPNTTYTGTITTGARDLAGNPMTINHVWNFTTIVPYVISLSSNPLAGGTTSGGGTINSCASATVIATPNSGYSFTNWTEGGTIVSTNTNYTFTVSGNRTLVANFTLNTYTVSLSSNPLAGGSTNGAGTFNWGTSVTVTATPNVGYTFTNWTENGTAVSTNANYTFTLTGNRTLVANYAAIAQYVVTLSRNPIAGGTVNGGGTFYSGTSVTVTATTNAGYSFTNWTENGLAVSTNSTYQFTIIGNRTLVANFALNPYTVTLSSNPALGGTTSGGGIHNAGSTVNVTATPAIGYSFVNWTENGNPVSTNANYSFVISSNRTLVANFALIPPTQFSVSLSSNPALGGTTNGGGNYNSGSNVTVTATPAVGYVFNNWTESGNPVSANASYTFVILANRILVANFTALPSGPPGVDLGAAGDFAILAGAGVTNTGFTFIYGDVGAFPTATINGFPPGVVNGTLYMAADPLVGTAKNALTAAYNDAQGRSLNAISLPGQLGGLTLAPGLYVNSSTSGISGTGANAILTLDAGGNPNAVWIFKMGSTLITDAGTSIVLAGGAKWENIYWSVGTSATLGTGCIFYGNILADQSITLTTGATLRGRALTRIAAVTLDANIVDKR